ncbi:hypothetical protein MRX96_050109 [Rhipicephalus microplus]
MTSFPISGVQKTGKKVFIRRGEPDSSSTVSSITDTSSSVADGKWKTVVNRQLVYDTALSIAFQCRSLWPPWGTTRLKGLLIGILLLSVIGIIIVAYFAVVRYTTEENPDST